MAEVWDHMSDQVSWNLMFATALINWKMDVIVNLLNALLKEKVSSELDKMSWNRRKGDSFSVKKSL